MWMDDQDKAGSSSIGKWVYRGQKPCLEISGLCVPDPRFDPEKDNADCSFRQGSSWLGILRERVTGYGAPYTRHAGHGQPDNSTPVRLSRKTWNPAYPRAIEIIRRPYDEREREKEGGCSPRTTM